MKIAIIYTTKGGTTRECAELLSKELKGHDVTVADMSEAPDLDMYDTVVIGFPIRAAKPAKAAIQLSRQPSSRGFEATSP